MACKTKNRCVYNFSKCNHLVGASYYRYTEVWGCKKGESVIVASPKCSAKPCVKA
ncbi:hypothetical protein BASU617_19020 [Bacillus subtilis]